MPNKRLVITTSSNGTGQNVSLAGELDASTAPTLEAHLDDPDVRARPVILELSELGFIDSAGLGVVVAAHRTWAEAGLSFVLQDVPERVVSVITYAGLLDHLEIR